MVEMLNAYKIVAGKSEDEKQFWSPRYGWEDNIQKPFNEIGCEVKGCSHVA
jgi:hypothetical protein